MASLPALHSSPRTCLCGGIPGPSLLLASLGLHVCHGDRLVGRQRSRRRRGHCAGGTGEGGGHNDVGEAVGPIAKGIGLGIAPKSVAPISSQHQHPHRFRDRSTIHILTDFEKFLSRTSHPSPFKRSDEEIRKFSSVIEKANLPKVFVNAGPQIISTPSNSSSSSSSSSDLDPRVQNRASVETRVTHFIQRHCRTIMDTSTRDAYLLSSLKQAVSLYFGPPSALDFPHILTKLSPEFSCKDGFLVRAPGKTHPLNQRDRKKIIQRKMLPSSSKLGL